jgi:VTC domain
MSIASEIERILLEFTPISLDKIQQASLMRRKDSKYVYSYVDVPAILSAVGEHYLVLEIEGQRSHNYQTFYYDTPGLDMYHMHHRGMVNRYKIRFRKYGSSDVVYLEVKKKDARGVTVKSRIKKESQEGSILSNEEEFLTFYTPYEHENIFPVLENNFNRITLICPDRTERITIDYHLWFSSPLSEESIELPGISIAEIKYDRLLSASPFHKALRCSNIIPQRFSKYCTGMAILDPDLKQNLFKEKIRRVRKLNNDYLQSIKEKQYA